MAEFAVWQRTLLREAPRDQRDLRGQCFTTRSEEFLRARFTDC